MRLRGRVLRGGTLLGACLLHAGLAHATPYAERSLAARSWYTTVAMVANVVPFVSALYAPRCLPGYYLCKVSFAGACTIAAVGQLALSGGGDLGQTRALLYRGWSGDWILTGEHIAGDKTPQPLPEAPAPTDEGTWQPPPR
jgi:hypothetical protein